MVMFKIWSSKILCILQSSFLVKYVKKKVMIILLLACLSLITDID